MLAVTMKKEVFTHSALERDNFDESEDAGTPLERMDELVKSGERRKQSQWSDKSAESALSLPKKFV